MNDKNQNPNNHDPETGDTINLSYSLSKTDLFWYNLFFVRWLLVGAIAFFILAISAFILSLNMLSGDLKTTIQWAVMGFGIGFSMCGGSIAAIMLQIFFIKNKSVEQAMTRRNYIINPAGVAVFNERGKIVRTWKEIRKVVKAGHGFYIKTGDKIAIVIPRHVFTDKNEIKLFEKIVKQAAR
ncbi:MAG: YcxB family protein [candidate division Zixibacteria bacterium]|nr:YcxB family protein [candidate division Zixibacteria bacterium]